jgi:hypothetical protein
LELPLTRICFLARLEDIKDSFAAESHIRRATRPVIVFGDRPHGAAGNNED